MATSSTVDGRLAAWLSFAVVVKNLLGNYRADNYKEIVNNMLGNFRILGISMSTKGHFLRSHLDRFPKNLSDVSNEQGEWLHQDIKTMEERYQGRWDIKIMLEFETWCAWFKTFKKSWKGKFLSHWRQYFGHSGSTITSYLLFETCTYLM